MPLVDEAVLAWTRPHADPRDAIGPAWLEAVFQAVATAGGTAFILAVACAAVVALFLMRRRREALRMALTAGGAVALSQFLKTIFDRARPDDAYRLTRAIGASFPSTQTLISAAVCTALASIAMRSPLRDGIRRAAWILLLLIPLVTGASRVYLAAHWLTDVIAGWSLGIGYALLWRSLLLSPSGERPRSRQ